MRPQSIIMFERLYLASLAVNLGSIAIGYDAMAEQFSSEPGMAELGIGSGILAGAIAVGLAISLLLWFLIARKASNVAKWILIVLAAIGLISLPGLLIGPWDTIALLAIVSYALEIAAIVCLFRDDAKAWLSGEWNTDPGTFD